jgi:predicted type IV restriction endonuclease
MRRLRDLFYTSLLVLAIAGLVLAAIGFKVWQCDELFPEADTLACVLWK